MSRVIRSQRPGKTFIACFFTLADVVGSTKKKQSFMFWAVRNFGPKWGPQAEAASPKAPTSEADIRKQFEAMEQLIESENPSLERMEEFSEPY
jgi:hypothetical protein